MGKRVRNRSVVPQSIGLTYVAPDGEGRITIPSDFRAVFASAKPPISVAYWLRGRGFVGVYPENRWPVASERRLLQDAKEVPKEVAPDHLTETQLGSVQLFFRLHACRYLDGTIKEGWRLMLPSVVRAWLGLPPLETKRKGKELKKRGRPPIQDPPGLVVIGNFGAIELWNEKSLVEALTVDESRFKELTTEVIQILEHVRATS